VNIVIRADASVTIGNGHIMRCLTLADALQNRGAEVQFICRAHEGHLADFIRWKKYGCVLLNPTSIGTSWRYDAEETVNILNQGKQPDWLIVDHYSLNWRWESAMRPHVGKIMVINGQTQCKHDCDLFLHQTPMPSNENYRRLAPASCRFLSGVDFVLLRPEFSELRPKILACRKCTTDIRRLLVTFGGTDPNNLTGKILRYLAAADLPSELKVDVVIGATSTHLSDIQMAARETSVPTQVFVAANNMAEHMARADLAIGAGGMTAWERCCMGLPSIIIVAAENQRASADALEREGVCLSIRSEYLAGSFHTVLQRALHDRTWHERAISRSVRMVDGLGATRVADAIYLLSRQADCSSPYAEV